MKYSFVISISPKPKRKMLFSTEVKWDVKYIILLIKLGMERMGFCVVEIDQIIDPVEE